MIEFRSFRYDPDARLLYRGDEEIRLPMRAVAVLESFLKRPGQVVQKDDILASAWEGAFVGEDSLTQAVSQLRSALGDDPQRPTYIQTIPKRGYRFIAPVKVDGLAGPVVRVQSASTATAIRIFEWPPLPWLAAGLLVGALGTALFTVVDREPSVFGKSGVSRLSIVLPDGAPMQLTSIFRNMAISPSGDRVLYQGPLSTSGMYVRYLDRNVTRPVEGSEGFATATFSHDGSHVAFFVGDPDKYQDTTRRAHGSLVTLSLDGGPPVELARVNGQPSGLSWGADGTIVYATANERGLRVLRPEPGASPVLIGAEHGLNYLWPQILPDGKTVVANAGKWDGSGEADIVALSLESGDQQVLVEGTGMARFVASGHLVVGRQGQLLAVPFDPETLAVQGPPKVVLDGVSSWETAATIYFDVSLNGNLLYVPSEFPYGVGEIQLVSRDGQMVSSLPVRLERPQVSPDGRELVGEHAPTGSRRDLYTYTLGGGSSWTRLTSGRDVRNAIWTPDGNGVTFSDRREGSRDLYWMPSSGRRAPELLHDGEHDLAAESWSPDGRMLAFTEAHAESGDDIWLLPSGGKPVPFLRTRHLESGASFSPDGRWIAYHSDEAGTLDVYLRPVPRELESYDASGPGHKVRISTNCGGWPVWSRDGSELYFRSCSVGEEALWVASIDGERGTPVGEPRRLFSGAWFKSGRRGPSYSVTPDGQFVLVDNSATVPRMEVVLNWAEELTRLVPTDGSR